MGVINLKFDFSTFENILYSVLPDEMSITRKIEICFIFQYFFHRYEIERGEIHPNITAAQIRRAVERLEELPIPTLEYPFVIDKYFSTMYQNCDYRINHFLSGRIREIKYNEVTKHG